MDRDEGLVAIVLAAGRGERFGGGKLTAQLAGRPVLVHAVEAALASPARRIFVVARPGLPIPADSRLRAVTLESPALSDSLRAGLAAADGAEGAFVFLGDMPLVPTDMAARLREAIGAAPAALPIWRGRPGHPVLLSRKAFALVDGLLGDEGLGRALRTLPGVVRMPVEEEGVVLDVDHQDDLADLARRMGP